MHEVKVYDSSGNLKKVISAKQLNLREDEKSKSPNLFRRDKRTGKPWSKTPKEQVKAKIP